VGSQDHLGEAVLKERSDRVPEDWSCFLGRQFDWEDFRLVESMSDCCLSCGSKVAYPVDVSKGREQVASAIVIEQSHGVSTEFTCFSSLHGKESYWTHRDADPEEASDYVVEQRHNSRDMICLVLSEQLRFDFDIGFHDLYRVAIGFSGVLALSFDSGNLVSDPTSQIFSVNPEKMGKWPNLGVRPFSYESVWNSTE